MAEARIAPCPGRAESFRRFVLEAPLSAVLLDLDFRFVAYSPSFQSWMGYSGPMVGMRVDEAVPGSEDSFNEFKASLAHGQRVHIAVRRVPVPKYPGKFIFVRTQASYWHDDDGNVCGYLCLNQDVTAEQEADIQRQEMEILLRAVVESIPGSLVVQDAETSEYLLVNKLVAHASGLTPEDMIGRTDEQLFPENLEYIRWLDQRFIQLQQENDLAVIDCETIVRREEVETLRLKRVNFEDIRGRKRRLTIGEDVTSLLRATRALEAAVAEAKSANAAKSNFLANISHEIRTPLNGVLGMTQAMANDPLPPKQSERLDVIRQSGETLLTLLNDLLDMSKIEAGKLQIESVDFDLAEAIAGTCETFRFTAEQKGLRFEARLEDAAGMCRGDPTRLRQVISNLVSNAIKFTDKGAIEVVAARTGDDVHFSISDTGMGMAPETLERLFEKFVQADASTTRRFGGTGLGLAICRDLVQILGGKMTVESTIGEGSRFQFTLRLPPVSASAPRETAPVSNVTSKRSLRILAAEDNLINQRVLEAFLESAGYQATFVDNGVEAVKAWRNDHWDMILMDVQMPIMDGTEAAAIIRRCEADENRARTPILALTANAMSHQTDEYLAIGMDAVVPKPIEAKVLLETIVRIANTLPAAEPVPLARSA